MAGRPWVCTLGVLRELILIEIFIQRLAGDTGAQGKHLGCLQSLEWLRVCASLRVGITRMTGVTIRRVLPLLL